MRKSCNRMHRCSPLSLRITLASGTKMRLQWQEYKCTVTITCGSKYPFAAHAQRHAMRPHARGVALLQLAAASKSRRCTGSVSQPPTQKPNHEQAYALIGAVQPVSASAQKARFPRLRVHQKAGSLLGALRTCLRCNACSGQWAHSTVRCRFSGTTADPRVRRHSLLERQQRSRKEQCRCRSSCAARHLLTTAREPLI